ncbi:Gag-pol polyprotein [Camponotus japonicus]
MSRKAELLITVATDLYGKIARTHDNLLKLGAAKITVGAVEARLQSLEKYWSKFDTHNDELLNYLDQIADSEYLRLDIPALAEEAYLSNKGMLLDLLHSLKTEEKEAATKAREPSSQAPRTTLPRIQLPPFSGLYQDWPSFRDLFNSIIGQDTAISQVEKLHYLRTCLKGEAALLVGDLPVTGENFTRAWTELTRHYENKRLLVRSYLSRFSSLPMLKGESASELRKLLHGVINTVNSLESIGRPITSSEDYFVYSVTEKLDPRSRREWEHSVKGTTEPPSYSTLRSFLEERLQTLEALQPSKATPEPAASKSSACSNRSARVQHARKSECKRGRCSVCQQNHYIMFCDGYKAKTAAEKKQLVETANLCLNCLGKHKVSECASKKACSACGERHHTTLHDACTASAILKTSHTTRNSPNVPIAVLLATARVRITDRYGVTHVARALVDHGSESSLISEALVQRLRLARTPTSVAVFGVGGKQTGYARGRVALNLSSLGGGPTVRVSVLVFPRLTVYDGGIKADSNAWKYLDGLDLADPDFLTADPVDILLGADVYAAILQEGVRKGEPHQPVAQKTSLGWILSGCVSSPTASRRAIANACTTEEDLSVLVRQFWQQEELPVQDSSHSLEDRKCEEFFRRTYTRTPEGRYMVRLPVLEPLPNLAATRQSAQRVLASMEKRFVREPHLQDLYKDFMRQYEDLGHMSLADPPTSNRIGYLPHHGVMREASSTTKLRVVFNGSSTVSSGTSLNQHLLVGPNLLPQLADILAKWRRHRCVLATDVEKMYRQILIHPEDRDLQRILWRYKEVDKVREYQLNTVTYGLACAPFLAMRTLRQLADDQEERYPRGAAIIRRDVYLDDVLTGTDTKEEALALQRQLIDLCMAGGFPLRKWSTNDPTLLADIPVEHRMRQEIRAWRPHETHATLGLQWHPATDCFSFATRHISVTRITKRSALSLTSRLFDPLGWLAPAVVRAKIALQQIWLQGLGWDDPLDDILARTWHDYQTELPLLEQIRIPRWMGYHTVNTEIEVRGFADASESAYAAAVYLRIKSEKSWDTALLAAKTKVAPVKQVSLPRLELCAATLMVRLVSRLRTVLELPQAPVHLWSDSTVDLGWIRGHPARWKTYVANRVAEIQVTCPDARWHHVPGRENPADCASRGLSPCCPPALVAGPFVAQGGCLFLAKGRRYEYRGGSTRSTSQGPRKRSI